ncbi:cutl-18 [Pristionchus pacificus]|uniref:Cutl-18 n=1 Tax=Pristionchus pacificus TaxID=54126 RepID=A0A2A6BWE1_PRIPA|nr:cutl-18 [Pristionchus pacificus]|eukprot:PDM70209.1 cutl-18 [Pristionchus pacificus]
MDTIILLSLLLPYTSAFICSGSYNSLFHLPYPSNISNPSLKCFEECAKSDCDGVLLSEGKCFILSNSSFSLEDSTFSRKKCVSDLSHSSISQSASQLIVPDWEASIISTNTFDQCIVKCANDEKCSACQYFSDSHDCLVSRFESRNGPEPLPDIDGFNVSFARVISPIPKGDCSSSYHSFQFLPISTPIYGDVKLYNGSNGLEECISHCFDCTAIIYSSKYKECFIVSPSSSSSQSLNFIDDHFMILSSLCSPPSLPCNPLSSIYTARVTDSLSERITCLTRCLDDPSCRYGYALSHSECLTSSHPLQLAPTITRYCTNRENNEFDGAAVLYEESRFCGRGESINVTGINIVECMQLCITHPTKSCDAVSYDESVQTCSVFEGGKVERVDGNCSFLALNMVTFDTDKEFIQKLGDQITEELLSKKGKWRSGKKGESRKKNPRARGLKLKRKKKMPRIIEDGDEIEVKTVCNMDSIKVLVNSHGSEIGEVFVKDRSSLCNSTLSNSSERILEIRLDEWEKCGVNKKEFVYSFDVVVKRDSTSQIVTKKDGIYRVACDYSNAHTTTVSSILRMGENSYNKLPMNGKIKVGNELKMELRSKKNGKSKNVQVGQLLQLVFTSSSDGHFNVNSCTAMNEKKTESVEIIESG